MVVKMKDKRECYHFLSHECSVYLPSYDTITIWHLWDLASNSRTKIYGKDVQHINVPQYEGLKIECMLAFAGELPSVMRALPSVLGERKKLPRQYIANVINTMVGAPFRDWVNQQVNIRHAKVKDDRNMNIELDPEIFNVFKASQAISGRCLIYYTSFQRNP